MRKNVIVAVAGHVDHGKTSLVKALTGIDTDRLPEEKKRGLSIEPGFAYLETSDFSFDFVDIPGHKNYFPNALRSLFGPDLALLVVAANDGLMPQTIEHFEVLKALGVQSGLIVLTKCDLVDEETIQLARKEIADLVESSFLEGQPVIEFSLFNKAGIEEVKRELGKLALNLTRNSEERFFRYFIDRSFILKGEGKVVTGLVTSGSLEKGEKLEVFPGGEIAVVRKMERHRREVNSVREGERAGLNLATKANLKRGMVLGKPGTLFPSRLMNAEIMVFKSAPRPLHSREKVYVYHYSTEAIGKVVFWQKEVLNPGEKAFVQLRLESPLIPFFGDPLIIRFLTPPATAGGGLVIDTKSVKLRKGNYFYFDTFNKYATMEEKSVFTPLSRSFARTLSEISLDTGFTEKEVKRKMEPFLERGRIKAVDFDLFVSEERFNQALEMVLEFLKKAEKDSAFPSCFSLEEFYTRLSPTFNFKVFKAVLKEAVSRESLKLEGHKLWLKRRSLSFEEARARKIILEKLSTGMPVREAEVFSLQGEKLKNLRLALSLLLKEGKILKFKDGAYMERRAFEKAQESLLKFLTKKGEITVIEAKKVLGWGRRATVSFLEHLDSLKITFRKGDKRALYR